MLNRIEEFRIEKGLMKGWIAEQAGIHRNSLTSIIRGAEPHLSVADKIAKSLGKTLYEVWPDLISEKE
ncbi:helix-turn-helix domain-containing protein [Paenibacillus sp. LMG 31457]|uniref:Helix-turn-helix domain-containing protein n=1 Tax=Paenibacillus planticolens TaxID=2654976 RepID=A0ABX1ZR87_9BACL|nr:helix-turn-helix domain-containing protein [Paenibacillus planticolens]